MPRIVESTEPSHLQLVGNLEAFGQAASFAVLRVPSYSNEKKNQSCPTHVGGHYFGNLPSPPSSSTSVFSPGVLCSGVCTS